MDAYIAKVCAKFSGIEPENLEGWKNKVLELVDSDIVKLKRKVKTQRTNPILKQSEVLDYLASFHEKFVMTPIDKASSNVAVICETNDAAPRIILPWIKWISLWISPKLRKLFREAGYKV